MQGVPEEQEELFNLSNIQQMLDVNSQTELLPPFYIRKLHRNPECVMPVGNVQLEFVAQISKPISRHAVQYFNSIVRNAGRTVLFSEIQHSVGELSHYFDRVWVVTGVKQERVVCCQQNDTCTFTILQHTPNSYAGHRVYTAFINFVEERWYFLKA